MMINWKQESGLAISFLETDSCQKPLLPAEQDDFNEANLGNPQFSRIY